MARVTITLLFLAMISLVVLVIVPTPSFAYSLLDHYTLHVINDFKTNEKPLVIHCWTDNSGSHDLGERTLWKLDEFSVRFRERFLRLTHYWCQMRHDQLYKERIVLYDSNGPQFKCLKGKNCYWSIREDGFFFSEDQQNWVKYQAW